MNGLRRIGSTVFVTAALGTALGFVRSNGPVARTDAALEGATPRSDSAEWAILGRHLFSEQKLSLDSSISCATCHQPYRAFSENRAVSHGIGTRARKRNAPSLINISLGRFVFDWDGRTSSLEGQLQGVFAENGDMGIDLVEAASRVAKDPEYSAEIIRLTGHAPVAGSVVRALVSFEKSLVAGDSRFERYYFSDDSTALTKAERRGWELFRGKAGCAGCHVPLPESGSDDGVALFMDRRVHNLGVGYEKGRWQDVGRLEVSGQPGDLGVFLTPSLRNVELTAPYMHDGSLATLEEVVDFYADGGRKNPHLDDGIKPRATVLSKGDREDLVAFLKTLTTEWLADSAQVSKRFLGTQK